MDKKIKRQRDERIRDRYWLLRGQGISAGDAIERIQTDDALNPMRLSEEYIRRFIVFGKGDLVGMGR